MEDPGIYLYLVKYVSQTEPKLSVQSLEHVLHSMSHEFLAAHTFSTIYQLFSVSLAFYYS